LIPRERAWVDTTDEDYTDFSMDSELSETVFTGEYRPTETDESDDLLEGMENL